MLLFLLFSLKTFHRRRHGVFMGVVAGGGDGGDGGDDKVHYNMCIW